MVSWDIAEYATQIKDGLRKAASEG